MRRAIIGVLVITFGLLLTACNTTEPPPDGQAITLKLEDASCTEAWIELTSTNLQLPTTITLKQIDPAGDTKSQILNLTSKDSLLYIDSLLPNKNYQYQASSIQHQVSSNELSVTTMDTTSHNFTFETFTFGEHSSSVLYDVAIIDENNVLAVGEIYMNDSLGQPDPNAYNIVRWDGSEWNIGRIAFTGGCHIIYPPIRAIWAFSENDIWFASGGSLVHYDGIEYYNDCSMNSIITPPLNKIWGTSSNDLYVVGSNGTIIRYNGNLWWRMGTVTTLDIIDIWGDFNWGLESIEVIAVGSNLYSGYDRIIIFINNNGLEILDDEDINFPLSGVWFISKKKYYVAGSGIYERHNLYESKWQNGPLDITNYYIFGIRGNDVNDIAAVGGNGEVIHFNGFSWKSFLEKTKLNYGNYYEVSIKNDVIVSVGQDSPQAVITLGKR
ncbi:MAG: glucosyl transferase [Ignavibacteriaceae bacterium]|nr:glucosyl transferase [Ignavibacteriaceae bacterium]